MNQIQFKNRCKCNETFLTIKKQNAPLISEGKPFQYPQLGNVLSKTICIKYPYKISLKTKFLFNSFQNKYLFYAIDDIIADTSLILTERETLLSLLYSCATYLKNHFLIDFFDIWLHNICIQEELVVNKFINHKSKKLLNLNNYITIQVFYKTQLQAPNKKSLW